MAFLSDNNIIHIALSCDEKYAPHTGQVIASILSNTKNPQNINFYILNKYLTDKTKKLFQQITHNIQFIQINRQDFKNCFIPKNTHFSIETYFRLKLSSIFNNLDKVLYLDSDITVLGDIKKLYNTNIEVYYAAAVPDIAKVTHINHIIGNNIYFNAGILLVNCKKWREDNIEEKLFNFAHTHKNDIIWVDQDVLNAVLVGNIKYLPRSWNAEFDVNHDEISALFPNEEMNIIHYISPNKPWNTTKKYKYAKFYFKYLLHTPWKFNTIRIPLELNIKKLLNPMINWIKDFKNTQRLIKSSQNKRVILWGASNYLKHLIKHQNLNSKNIIGIIDRDKNKTGTKLGKYTIYSPDDITHLKPDLIVSTVVNRPRMKKYIKDELKDKNINVKITDIVLKH